ncbi:MAG: hypothetical protein ABIS67_10515, partial [Candidatus Eisenbacteria bacterium]
MLCGLLALAAVATICVRPDRVIVAEVYYDAIGDDTGHEFIELFNPTGAAIGLNGLRLESGDGAGPGRWTPRWTGGLPDSVAPGGRFVIGGALVDPPPGAVASLDLQNGPDAMRLVWPDGVVEVVGYGTLAHAEYFCGAPAADVASGLSLARLPDAADLGSNAADFAGAPPSPGRPNQARRNLSVSAGGLALVPERPEPGRPAILSGRLANTGADTIGVGELSLRAEVESVGEAPGGAGVDFERANHAATLSRLPRAHVPNPPVLGPFVMLPGDTLAFDITLEALEAGKHRVWVTASVARDENPADDRASLLFLVGPGPLAVTEIQFHPADGEGEWVEVRNRSARPLDPAAFTISDRGTGRGVPREGFGLLAPESLAVFAQDRAALLAAYPGLNSARVWQAGPWPALNNTNDSAGVADQVVVRDRDGLVGERIAYGATGVPNGVSLEWRDGAWQPALDPRGSPLAPPRALPPAARRFEVLPGRVAGSGGRISLVWALPWSRARVRADLYDLDGRLVAELMPEAATAGRGTRELA